MLLFATQNFPLKDAVMFYRLARRACCFVFAVCLAVLAATSSTLAASDGIKFFRIGAGPTGGTVFPAAGWIGAAISNPPGSRPCEKRGRCGVPGLIAVVQSTEGGVDNIEGLRRGSLDAGIAYADMAHAALKGEGVFSSQGPFKELNAVTSLAPESLHVLVRKDSDIHTIADLKGKRIAVGPRYSTSQALSFMVLRLHGVEYGSFRWFLLNPARAAIAMDEDKIDAVMFLSRKDSGVARQMIGDGVGRLLSLDAKAIRQANKQNPFVYASIIPSSAYGGEGVVYTLEMLPVLLVKHDLDEGFVKSMSFALWKTMQSDPDNQPLATMAYRHGRLLRLGVPLHPGAVAFRQQIISLAREEAFPDPNYEASKVKE